VRVGAEDDVRAGVDRGVGEGALVVDDLALGRDTEVEERDEDIDASPGISIRRG